MLEPSPQVKNLGAARKQSDINHFDDVFVVEKSHVTENLMPNSGYTMVRRKSSKTMDDFTIIDERKSPEFDLISDRDVR